MTFFDSGGNSQIAVSGGDEIAVDVAALNRRPIAGEFDERLLFRVCRAGHLESQFAETCGGNEIQRQSFGVV